MASGGKSTRSAVPQAAGPAFPDLGPFPVSCSSWFLLREAQASAALISGRGARPTLSYSRSEPDSGAHYNSGVPGAPGDGDVPELQRRSLGAS